MNVSEARRVIDPETKTKEVLKIGEKYRLGPSGTNLDRDFMAFWRKKMYGEG